MRSSVLRSRLFSRLRCCAGDRSSSKIDQARVLLEAELLDLVHLAAPDERRRVAPLPLLVRAADDARAGALRELRQLLERSLAAGALARPERQADEQRAFAARALRARGDGRSPPGPAQARALSITRVMRTLATRWWRSPSRTFRKAPGRFSRSSTREWFAGRSKQHVAHEAQRPALDAHAPHRRAHLFLRVVAVRRGGDRHDDELLLVQDHRAALAVGQEREERLRVVHPLLGAHRARVGGRGRGQEHAAAQAHGHRRRAPRRRAAGAAPGSRCGVSWPPCVSSVAISLVPGGLSGAGAFARNAARPGHLPCESAEQQHLARRG